MDEGHVAGPVVVGDLDVGTPADLRPGVRGGEDGADLGARLPPDLGDQVARVAPPVHQHAGQSPQRLVLVAVVPVGQVVSTLRRRDDGLPDGHHPAQQPDGTLTVLVLAVGPEDGPVDLRLTAGDGDPQPRDQQIDVDSPAGTFSPEPLEDAASRGDAVDVVGDDAVEELHEDLSDIHRPVPLDRHRRDPELGGDLRHESLSQTRLLLRARPKT